MKRYSIALVLGVLLGLTYSIAAQPAPERQWGRNYLGVVSTDGTTVSPVRTATPLPVAGTITCTPSGTQTVDGTVTSNQGTSAAVTDPWSTRLSDGTNWIGAANPLPGQMYVLDSASALVALQLDSDGNLPTAAAPECALNPDPTTHIRRTTNAAFDIDPGEYGCFAIGETVHFALGDTAAADVGIPYVPGSQQDNCRISVGGAVAVEHSVHIGTTGVFVIVPCL